MIPDDFTGFKLKELTRNAKTQICWRFQGAILRYIPLKNIWSVEQVTDHVTLHVHGKNLEHIKLLEQWLFGYSLLVSILCF